MSHKFIQLNLALMMFTIGWVISGCEQGNNPVALIEPEPEIEVQTEDMAEMAHLAVDAGDDFMSSPSGSVTFLTMYGEEFDQEEIRGQMQTQYGLPALDPQNQVNLIIANGLLVQVAAEAFAAENGGVYPLNTGDRSAAGHTLIDLLPQGARLRNPITHLRDSPLNGFPGVPGQIGYTMVDHDGNGVPDGYHIEGLSKDPYTLVMVITRY